VQTLSCITTAEDIRLVENSILAIADERAVDSLSRARMQLVLDEMLTNIRFHSYPEGPGSIHIIIYPQVGDGDFILHCVIQDWGPEFNPLVDSPKPELWENIEERPIGGLGLHLVHNMRCGLRYERVREGAPSAGRNELTLSFPLRCGPGGLPEKFTPPGSSS
jgi:serine/threonine-protein kinase RsbW